jgi:hypothetical protein
MLGQLCAVEIQARRSIELQSDRLDEWRPASKVVLYETSKPFSR